MLAIKFQRVGKKHQPSYRLVVTEKRSKLGGPPVEQLGFYNPETKNASLEKERILHWIGIGAKPTPSVFNLFVKKGIVSGPKISIKVRASKNRETDGASQTGETATAAEKKSEPEAEKAIKDEALTGS